MFSQCLEHEKNYLSAKCCYVFGPLVIIFTCMNSCSNFSLPVIFPYLLWVVLLGIDGSWE